MTPEVVPVDEQGRALRQRIQSQRALIAQQLGPVEEPDGSYPRSKTMRFLSRSPAVAVTVLAEVATLFMGARHAKAVTAFMALSRIMRSAAGSGSRRARSARPPV